VQGTFGLGWQVWNVVVVGNFARQGTLGIAFTCLLQGSFSLRQVDDLIGFDLAVGECFEIALGLNVVPVGVTVGYRAEDVFCDRLVVSRFFLTTIVIAWMP